MSHTSESTSAPVDANMGYERSDTRGRSIFIGLGVSVIVLVVTVFALNEVFLMTQENVMMTQGSTGISQILNEVRSRSTHNLSTYEWADSTSGTVRIPIERAMQLMVEDAKRERLSSDR